MNSSKSSNLFHIKNWYIWCNSILQHLAYRNNLGEVTTFSDHPDAQQDSRHPPPRNLNSSLRLAGSCNPATSNPALDSIPVSCSWTIASFHAAAAFLQEPPPPLPAIRVPAPAAAFHHAKRHRHFLLLQFLLRCDSEYCSCKRVWFSRSSSMRRMISWPLHLRGSP